MNNKDYWSKRLEELERMQILNESKYLETLKEEYEKALYNIKKETKNWLARFSVNNQISLRDSKKWLNTNELKELKWDVEEYIKYGQENGIDLIWRKELENASAKVHISRLEALQIQIQNEIEKLSHNEQQETQNFIIDTYKDTYYKVAYELQKGHNVAFQFSALDENTIKRIISKPWTSDGYTFSDRIWKNKKALIDTLQKELTQSIIRGKAPDDVIDKISKTFGVSKNKAGTLVMTESAFFSSVARKDCFKDLGVEKYIIVATLDSRTSDICRNLDGQIFNMSDYKEGITAPPFHVNCRSTTAPYFADEFEFGERAARNTDGNTYYVPSNITYNEWKSKYIDSDPNIKKKFEAIQKTEKNKSADFEQYNRYKNILGEKELKETFESFQEMKYNNEEAYNDLKYLYALKSHYNNVIDKGELSALVDFNKYKETDKEVRNKLVGTITKNGIEIKSYSKHFIDRIFGSIEEKREGVELADIEKTIKESNKFKTSKKNGSIKIIGENNIVSINPKTGNLIQTNPYKEE